MPCCLVIILALILPRFTIILLWLFSGWFRGVFHAAIWPVLGFFFLPFTLLWYTAVHNWYGGVWGGGQILGLIVAVFLDVSSHGGGGRQIRRRSVLVKEIL